MLSKLSGRPGGISSCCQCLDGRQWSTMNFAREFACRAISEKIWTHPRPFRRGAVSDCQELGGAWPVGRTPHSRCGLNQRPLRGDFNASRRFSTGSAVTVRRGLMAIRRRSRCGAIAMGFDLAAVRIDHKGRLMSRAVIGDRVPVRTLFWNASAIGCFTSAQAGRRTPQSSQT